MKRIISLTLLSLFSVSMLSACNTVAGAGKDVQKVGEKVEKKAEDCKDGRCGGLRGRMHGKAGGNPGLSRFTIPGRSTADRARSGAGRPAGRRSSRAGGVAAAPPERHGPAARSRCHSAIG